MTENEEKLFNNLMKHNSAYCGYELSKGEIKTLLQAFEQLRRYRAIGTIDEFKRAKEMEAVYGQVKWEKDVAISQLEEIGVGLGQKMDEFKALKEKNEPRKPDYEGDGYYNGQIVLDTWICPNCRKEYEVDYDDYNFCPNCGQHIDHSGLTEDD